VASWIRVQHNGDEKFGTVENDEISVFDGDMFGPCEATGEVIKLSDATLLTPCVPQKMFGLWNNFHATAEKTGLPLPEHPWYFVMTPNTYAPGNSTIQRPNACSGKILFEGELGVVIGKTCKEVDAGSIAEYILCFDGFGVFGPVITTSVDPAGLSIKTFLQNGDEVQERQNYPVSDMIYSPLEAVSRISHDMTLQPGDIVACGTSVGAGAMKDGWTVRVSIEGVGELENTYSQS